MTSHHLIQDPQRCCLILIDIQEKLEAVMQDREKLIQSCSILIQMANTLKIPILWCEQAPKALGLTVATLKELLREHQPIKKICFSCCESDTFIDQIERISPSVAILCGIETHVCVFQTAADLLESGMKIYIIADAISSRTSENKNIGIARMASSGAIISSVEMLLFELLKDAKHEKFKELAAKICDMILMLSFFVRL